MPTLYLVRHAEPELTGVMLGKFDSPLSAAGKQAAAAIKLRLRPAVVFSSPLLRARQTAELLSDREPIVLAGLCEIGYGDWDGMKWNEIDARDPELARRKLADWFGVTPPGGEPWSEFEARVRRAGEEIVRSASRAIVVAHAAVNSVLAATWSGVDPREFQQQYGEVVVVDV